MSLYLVRREELMRKRFKWLRNDCKKRKKRRERHVTIMSLKFCTLPGTLEEKKVTFSSRCVVESYTRQKASCQIGSCPYLVECWYVMTCLEKVERIPLTKKALANIYRWEGIRKTNDAAIMIEAKQEWVEFLKISHRFPKTSQTRPCPMAWFNLS